MRKISVKNNQIEVIRNQKKWGGDEVLENNRKKYEEGR
jgi:hypothetical protein